MISVEDRPRTKTKPDKTKRPAKKGTRPKKEVTKKKPTEKETKPKKKISEKKPVKKEDKRATKDNGAEKEGFRKGLRLTSIPRTGKVNVIELRQGKRTDFLFTRLEEELAVKYSLGRVPAKYAFTDGQLALIVTKYRGDAIDANNQKVGECYTLLFTDHYAMINADLEDIVEDISDEEIKEQIFVLDESKALRYKNKWLVERERRINAEEYKTLSREETRLDITQGIADVIDDRTLADNAVRAQMDSFDRTSIENWIKKNWMMMMIGILGLMVFSSMF